jgi:glycosyltransferase involved in cell wall biosynthesis
VRPEPLSKQVEFECQPAILLVGNFLSSSLSTRGVCEDLAVKLASRGRTVLTTSNKPIRCLRLLDMLKTVWTKRSEYTVASVDTYSGLAFVWAEVACLLLTLIGKPYVLILHGGNLPQFAGRWPRRVGRLLRSAAAVTTPSRYLLERMTPFRSDLQLIPNFVELEGYRFALRVAPQPRLVWLRAFHAIYNPCLAIRTLALLRQDFPGIQLSMLGPDKGDGSLQATVRAADKLGVTDHLSVVGPIPKSEVPLALRESDVFLNTTSIDNTPVSVLEAMASGLCVVSTNVGGIPYLLKHDHDALLVPPDDPTLMAGAIRRLLTEPGLAERLSRNARLKAEQFDWRVILPQWESLFSAFSAR